MEDSEDDVDVLDLVNNDNKNAEKKGKFPISHNLYKLMKVCNFNVAGHDQRCTSRLWKLPRGQNRKRTKHPEIVDLLDDNVGNEIPRQNYFKGTPVCTD